MAEREQHFISYNTGISACDKAGSGNRGRYCEKQGAEAAGDQLQRGGQLVRGPSATTLGSASAGRSEVAASGTAKRALGGSYFSHVHVRGT
eukprot:152454-Pyramimonas_sp.AAC.1